MNPILSSSRALLGVLARRLPPAGGAALLAGAAAGSLLTSGAGILSARAGAGPAGASPLWLAAGLSVALSLLAARVLPAPGSPWEGRPGLHVRGAVTALALAGAGLHGLLLEPIAGRLSAMVIALSRGEERSSPGLAVESLAALAVLGPPLAAAVLVWAGSDRRGTPQRLGCLCLGALAGGLLGLPATAAWSGGHPVAPSLLMLASAAAAFRPGRSGPRAAPAAGGPLVQNLLSVEGQASFALVMGGGGFAIGLLAWSALRLGVLVSGRPAGLAAFAVVTLAGVGCGALAAGGTVRRGRGPWRAMAFHLAAAGAMGMVAGILGDRLPEAYLTVLESWGRSAGSERAASLAVASLAGLGLAVTAGAAAGAASLMRDAAAYLALGSLGLAGGLLAAPALVMPLGLRSLILSASSLLMVAAGFTALLGEGRLLARGARAVALMAVGIVLLVPGEGWSLSRFLAAPGHHPGPLPGPDPSPGGGEPGTDRVLLYLDGPRSTAGLALLHGEIPAAFLDGRLRPAAGPDAGRALALTAHLPMVLGVPGRRALVVGPALPETLEALADHGLHPTVAPGDGEVARLLATSGGAIRPGAGSLSAHPARILGAGPRRVLAAAAEPWDLILLPPPVDPGQLVDLVRENGLLQMREALAPGGLAVLALPLEDLDVEGIRAAGAAFEAVFPGCRAWLYPGVLALAGGHGPVRLDLAAMDQAARRSRALTAAGLDDPLKLVAGGLLVKELIFPAAASTAALEETLERSMQRARMERVQAASLEWILEKMQGPASAPSFPGGFTPEAVAAVEQRLAVLREVARLNLRARISLLLGREEELEAAATASVRRDPSDGEARSLLARAFEARGDRLLEAGDLPGARAAYSHALRHRPETLGALNALAWIRHGDGDLAGAEQLLQRAVRAAPWISQTWYRLGLVRYEAGDPEGARRLLGEAHWLDPSAPGPLILLGDIARLEGDLEKSRSFYEQALETGSRTVEIQAALASVSLQEGDLKGARKEIEQALRRKPGDPEALMTRARIRIQEEDLEGARRDLLAAITTGGARYRARALLEPELRQILLSGSPEGGTREEP